jgi:butyrate kinase
MKTSPAKLLIINPGSTSTKVAVFEDARIVCEETLRHSPSDLAPFPRIADQFEFRKNCVLKFLRDRGYRLEDFSAVVGRGGLLKPVAGGTYAINDAMLADARAALQGEHPSNLGCLIAHSIAAEIGAPSFVVDPPSVDEFEPLARYSGLPEIERKSLSHALNIHAVARRVADALGKPLDQTRFVIAHLGGGISVCPVNGGRIVDANDASNEGPFSPSRTGSLPAQSLLRLAFSGKYTQRQMLNFITRNGGLLAYLGTDDAREVERRITAGDKRAAEIYEAMAYQIAKEIGAMATALCGQLDAIILTGGMAHREMLVGWIVERVKFIAPVRVVAGEFEMQALAEGALRVLRGEEQAKVYS